MSAEFCIILLSCSGEIYTHLGPRITAASTKLELRLRREWVSWAKGGAWHLVTAIWESLTTRFLRATWKSTIWMSSFRSMWTLSRAFDGQIRSPRTTRHSSSITKTFPTSTPPLLTRTTMCTHRRECLKIFVQVWSTCPAKRWCSKWWGRVKGSLTLIISG